MKSAQNQENRYGAIIEHIFLSKYRKGITEIVFSREDIPTAAKKLKIELPKNLGDIIYSIRYRMALPQRIAEAQPDGLEWIIEGKGRSQYVFRLVPINRIIPNRQLAPIKIPDATPEIVTAYALSDEQALLAKVRYNRLIDIFLGIVVYSLQSHLRTTVTNLGQVEIDEMYVGVDKKGHQYIIPVQAKGGTDQLSTVQTKQDITCCTQKFPNLVCRSVSAQFIESNLIALFELTHLNDQIKIVDERHYHLVPADQIAAEDLRRP